MKIKLMLCHKRRINPLKIIKSKCRFVEAAMFPTVNTVAEMDIAIAKHGTIHHVLCL